MAMGFMCLMWALILVKPIAKGFTYHVKHLKKIATKAHGNGLYLVKSLVKHFEKVPSVFGGHHLSMDTLPVTDVWNKVIHERSLLLLLKLLRLKSDPERLGVRSVPVLRSGRNIVLVSLVIRFMITSFAL